MGVPLPGYIQLYPTLRCNQACSFCFNRGMGQSADMSSGEAGLLLDIMRRHAIPEIDIMGGEPFLLSWLPDFIRTAAQQDICVNVSTNGSLPEALRGLQGMAPERVTVGISIEGSTRERHDQLTCAGNFLAAIDSLSYLRDIGLDPLVKTVVNRDTADDIQKIIALIRGIGIRRYYMIHMDVLSGNAGDREKALSYPQFLSFFRTAKAANPGIFVGSVAASCFNGTAADNKVRCAGGTRKISIMPDGSVYPCNLFQHSSEFELGNIFRDDLAVIMSHPRLSYFRDFFSNLCPAADCTNRARCTGGCPAHGYRHFHDLNAPDIRCTT